MGLRFIALLLVFLKIWSDQAYCAVTALPIHVNVNASKNESDVPKVSPKAVDLDAKEDVIKEDSDKPKGVPQKARKYLTPRNALLSSVVISLSTIAIARFLASKQSTKPAATTPKPPQAAPTLLAPLISSSQTATPVQTIETPTHELNPITPVALSPQPEVPTPAPIKFTLPFSTQILVEASLEDAMHHVKMEYSEAINAVLTQSNYQAEYPDLNYSHLKPNDPPIQTSEGFKIEKGIHVFVFDFDQTLSGPFSFFIDNPEPKLKPGAIELLTKILADGHYIYINTTSNGDKQDAIRNVLRKNNFFNIKIYGRNYVTSTDDSGIEEKCSRDKAEKNASILEDARKRAKSEKIAGFHFFDDDWRNVDHFQSTIAKNFSDIPVSNSHLPAVSMHSMKDKQPPENPHFKDYVAHFRWAEYVSTKGKP